MISIEQTERELADAQHRLARLEERREALAGEHSRAVEERLKLLLDGDGENLKALTTSDARVTAAESALAGVEDALVAVRAKTVEITERIVDQRDHQARLGEAQFVRETLATIKAAAEDYKRSAQTLVDAIAVLGSRSPEAEMLSAQVPLAATIDPAVQQFSRDLLGYISDMERGGKARVPIFGVKPEPKPVPIVRPDGPPSGTKYQPPLSALRVRHPGF